MNSDAPKGRKRKKLSAKKKAASILMAGGSCEKLPPSSDTHRHRSRQPWEAVVASSQQEPQVTQRKQTKTTAAQPPGQRSLDSCAVQPQGALVTLTSSCLSHPCLLSSGGPRAPRRGPALFELYTLFWCLLSMLFTGGPVALICAPVAPGC